MIGKHNTGGFKVPAEPPVWPASDLDEDEISIIGKIIKVCKEQYELKNIFPYYFEINPGKPYWKAKVSAQNEFNDAVILDFSYDGRAINVMNVREALSNNRYQFGCELNDVSSQRSRANPPPGSAGTQSFRSREGSSGQPEHLHGEPRRFASGGLADV